MLIQAPGPDVMLGYLIWNLCSVLRSMRIHLKVASSSIIGSIGGAFHPVAASLSLHPLYGCAEMSRLYRRGRCDVTHAFDSVHWFSCPATTWYLARDSRSCVSRFTCRIPPLHENTLTNRCTWTKHGTMQGGFLVVPVGVACSSLHIHVTMSFGSCTGLLRICNLCLLIRVRGFFERFFFVHTSS